MMATLIHSKQKISLSKVIPSWLLRIVGLSSLAIALMNILLLCWRKPAPKQKFIKSPPSPNQLSCIQTSGLKRTTSSLADIQRNNYTRSPSPTSSPSPLRSPSRLSNSWTPKFIDNMLSLTKKKRMTISLKNTILWNPSQDVNSPNHAFHENAIQLLYQLCQRYDIYLLIHITSQEEQDQIDDLLQQSIIKNQMMLMLDRSRIIYCQTEQEKQDIIQHQLCPAIHIEGGWELDDGEDLIRQLRSSIQQVVWVITRRRRTSFNKENIKQKDQDILADNVELTDSILDTSFAHDIGFMLDNYNDDDSYY
ncbi:unnamed protein product [Cunninghamella echinulata]